MAATKLHGSTQHRSPIALLLVDVINGMDFPEGRALARHATSVAKRIAGLKKRAKAARVPVIYANDNYGQWQSDFRATLERAIAPDMPGREVSLMLAPEQDDYFVLKPKHSAFFGTPLEILLHYLGTKRVVVAGFAGDLCIQSTAHDAFLRDIEVTVPSDCVASETLAANRRALEYLRTHLKCSVVPSARVNFRARS